MVLTRSRVPLDWATTQYNLGAALAALGQRETGTARLEEAVGTWDNCLKSTGFIWSTEWISRVHARRDEVRAEIERRQNSCR